MSTNLRGSSKFSWSEIFKKQRNEVLDEVQPDSPRDEGESKVMEVEKLREDEAEKETELENEIHQCQNDAKRVRDLHNAWTLAEEKLQEARGEIASLDEQVNVLVKQEGDLRRQLDAETAKSKSLESEIRQQLDIEIIGKKKLASKVVELRQQLNIEIDSRNKLQLDVVELRRQLGAEVDGKKSLESEVCELRRQLGAEVDGKKSLESEVCELRRQLGAEVDGKKSLESEVSIRLRESSVESFRAQAINYYFQSQLDAEIKKDKAQAELLHEVSDFRPAVFSNMCEFDAALTSETFDSHRLRRTLAMPDFSSPVSVSIRRQNESRVDIAVLLDFNNSESYEVYFYNLNVTPVSEITFVGQKSAQLGCVVVACDNSVYLASDASHLRLFDFSGMSVIFHGVKCIPQTLQQLHTVSGGVVFCNRDLFSVTGRDGKGNLLFNIPISGIQSCLFAVSYTGRYYAFALTDKMLVCEVKDSLTLIGKKEGNVVALGFFPSSHERKKGHLAAVHQMCSGSRVVEVYRIEGQEVSIHHRVAMRIANPSPHDLLVLPTAYTMEAPIWMLNSMASQDAWVLNSHSRTVDALQYPNFIMDYCLHHQAIAMVAVGVLVVSLSTNEKSSGESSGEPSGESSNDGDSCWEPLSS